MPDIKVGDYVTTTRGIYIWENYDPEKRHKVVKIIDGKVHVRILDDGAFDEECDYGFYEIWITGVYR